MKFVSFERLGSMRAHVCRLAWAFACILAVFSSACGQAPPAGEATESTAEAVGAGPAAIAPTRASIPVGVTQQFTAPAGAVWSVDDPSVASVSSTGLATGLQAGKTKVRATVGAEATAAALVVTDATLQAIAVSPQKETLTLTKTVKSLPAKAFLATGLFQDGESSQKFPLDATTTTWTSSDVGIATVSPSGVPTAVSPGTVQITATDTVSGVSGRAMLVVSGKAPTGVTLSPTTATLPVGFAQAFTATGLIGKAKATLSSADIVWSVDDPTVATVTDTGLVEALATGRTSVHATDVVAGVSGAATIVVVSGGVGTIEVSVASSGGSGGAGPKKLPSKTPELSIGATLQLEATAVVDLSKQKLPLAPETTVWATSDESLATVSSTGAVTGVSTKAGSVTLTATDTKSGKSGTIDLRVLAAPLNSVEISDSDPAQQVVRKGTATTYRVHEGATQAFVLTAVYGASKATLTQTASAAWTTSDSTIALVSNSGASAGEVTGLKAGTVTLTAVFEKKKAQTKITVSAAKIVSIAVSPLTSAVARGLTEPLAATATYKDGTVQDVTRSVTWITSAPFVSISNADATSGLATAMDVGTAVVSATDDADGVAGNGWVTVTDATLASLSITPPGGTLEQNQQLQYRATGVYSDSTVKDLTSAALWTSSAPDVATVSNGTRTSGLVSAIGAGRTTIGAFDPTTAISAPDALLTVNAVTLASLAITPASASIPAGFSQAFTATGTYSDGSTQDLTSAVLWSVPSGTATIGVGTGVATGLAAGASAIQAVDGDTGLTATATLNVTAAVLTSIRVAGAAPAVPVGATDAFTATGAFSDGSTQDLTASVTWSAADAFVTISNVPGSSGVATGTSVGSTTIMATDPTTGLAGTAPLSVTGATLASIAVTPSGWTLDVGDSQPFDAVGTYSDGSTQDLTAEVTWSSSDSTILSMSNDPASAGLGTALESGEVSVTATDPATGVSGVAYAFVTGSERSAGFFESDDSATFVTTTIPASSQSFTVIVSGTPQPTVSESGALPSGMSFDPSTATLSGTPAGGTAGTYDITFIAENGLESTQDFTLQVSGTMPNLTVPTPSSQPYGIAAGPDGNMWFTEYGANQIGVVTTAGAFTEYPIPTAKSEPEGIAAGPDGNVWFVEFGGNKIGRITPGGAITEFTVPTAGSGPTNVALGPDGNLWFTEWYTSRIGVITPAGAFTEYTIPTAKSCPSGIAPGPDGNVWFTEAQGNNVGSVTPSGAFTEYPIPSAGASAFQMTLGGDGNLWFSEWGAGNVASLTTGGVITEYPITGTLDTPPFPDGIVAMSDGTVWFTDANNETIDLLNGTIVQYATDPSTIVENFGLAYGPDGNLWFTAYNGNVIGRVSP